MDINNTELFDWFDSLEDKGYDYIFTSFQDHFAMPVEFSCNKKSLGNKIKKVATKVKEFKRKGQKIKLENYLAEKFVIPTAESNYDRAVAAASTQKENKLTQELNYMKRENKSYKRKLDQLENIESISERYVDQVNAMEDINNKLKLLLLDREKNNTELTKDIDSIKKECELKNKQVELTEQKLSTYKKKYGTEKIRNLNKKIKLRDQKINANTVEIQKLKEMTETLDNEVIELMAYIEKKTEHFDKLETQVNDFKTEEKSLLRTKQIICKIS